jgi:hypothetical protein
MGQWAFIWELGQKILNIIDKYHLNQHGVGVRFSFFGRQSIIETRQPEFNMIFGDDNVRCRNGTQIWPPDAKILIV